MFAIKLVVIAVAALVGATVFGISVADRGGPPAPSKVIGQANW